MLNCSRQSNCFFLYGPVCIYVHSCHIKAAAASGWGECGGALKDILMTTVCEGWASPELPPACPLDYFAISPHALAEFLGDIRASISHTAALTLPPATTPLCFASPLALQINFFSVQVCMCALTHHTPPPPPLCFCFCNNNRNVVWEPSSPSGMAVRGRVVPRVSERAHAALFIQMC